MVTGKCLHFLYLLSLKANNSGADPGFQVRGGGAHIKNLRRAEGDAKNVGVFRVKNHDFTPKNLIFSNFRGRGGGGPGGSAPVTLPQSKAKTSVIRPDKKCRNIELLYEILSFLELHEGG